MMKALKTAVFVLCLASTACNNQATTPEATREKNKDTVVVNKTDTVHNSKNSLDWAGVYEGELPCADCSRIITTISVNADGSFKKKEVYQGKKGDFESRGVFAWDSTGSIIILSDGPQKTSYKVGENKLIALDMEGKLIEGALADKYILVKVQ